MDAVDTVYFRDPDSETLYACIGPMGANGVFRLRDAEQEWEYLVTESPTWDEIHQRIYRNFKMHRVKPEDLPGSLPTIPAKPSGDVPPFEDYFRPSQPILAVGYPNITDFLRPRENASCTVYILLEEDRYETSFGDGEFHYLHDVFLRAEEAHDRIARETGEWARFHLRPCTITLEEGSITIDDSSRQRYDRHHTDEVLRALEIRLATMKRS